MWIRVIWHNRANVCCVSCNICHHVSQNTRCCYNVNATITMSCTIPISTTTRRKRQNKRDDCNCTNRRKQSLLYFSGLMNHPYTLLLLIAQQPIEVNKPALVEEPNSGTKNAKHSNNSANNKRIGK